MTSEIDHVFMQLGQNLGMRNLKLDDNGVLSLVFDDQLMVEAQTAPEIEALFLIAAISAMPEAHEDPQRKLFGRLLEAPLNRAQMAGAFFAVDPESEEILLVRTIGLSGLNAQLLEKELERFVNTLEYWIGQVHNGILVLEDKPAPGAGAPQAFHGGAAVRI